MACKGHVDVVVLRVKHNADANGVKKIVTRDGRTAVLDLLKQQKDEFDFSSKLYYSSQIARRSTSKCAA